MGKILAALLIVAAIALAAYYLLSGRKLRREDAARARGWKRHLLIATAVVLAVVGALAMLPARQSPGHWEQVRSAWRAVTKYSKKNTDREAEQKISAHGDALIAGLSYSGEFPKDTAFLIHEAFITVVDHTRPRPPDVLCYAPVAPGSEVDAEIRLAKAVTELNALEASGKLTPAVIAKARDRIANEMMLASEHKPAAAEAAKAADVITQLLTSDAVPVVPDQPMKPE